MVGIDPGLFESCSQCSFRHIAGMIRDCSIPVCLGIVPDLVAPGCMAVESKTECLQALNDLFVLEAGESAHLTANYERIVEIISHRLQLRAGQF